MKKSLLISEIFPPTNGGSGRWFWEIYRKLPIDKVHFAVGKAKGDKEFDEKHAIPIARLNLSSSNWGLLSIKGISFYIRKIFQIIKLVKANNIEVVHCGRCLPEGIIALTIKKLLGTNYLCYIHGEDIQSASTSREFSLLVKSVLKNSSKLISNSQNTAGLLKEKWHISEEKISVMYPGVDTNKFYPKEYDQNTRKKLSWDNKLVVLTVGRLQKRKGHDIMLQTILKLKNTQPNILYSIIGSGQEEENLKKLARELNLTQHVQFLGEVSEETMIECFQQCNLFILPNRTVDGDIEGFGIVLLEAQACGKIVIAGNSGGTRETMIHDTTGFIVDCTTPDKIIDLLNKILTDESLNKKMGLAGRKHMIEHFDWKPLAEKARKQF